MLQGMDEATARRRAQDEMDCNPRPGAGLGTHAHDVSASSSDFASFRSSVSNPSVNRPVKRSKQIASLLRFALVAPEAREAHGGAEFARLCWLLTRDGEGVLEMLFSLPHIRLRPQKAATSR